MRCDKPLFKVEENSCLDDEVNKALEVKSVLFESADHLPIDELDKRGYFSLIDHTMPNVVIPQHFDQIIRYDVFLLQQFTLILF
jgi:hypothetical protein